MKVLHLVSSGGFFGAERVIVTLASQNNGIDCWVGALNNAHNPHLEIIREAQALGVKTIVFDSQGQIDLRTIASIKKFLIDNQIDILHTHNFKSDIVGFWATRSSRTQWVATNHVWHSTDIKMRFYEGIDAFVLKFARMIFTVSQEIKDGMLRIGFKENHIHVVHNGITVSQFNQKNDRPRHRKELKVSDNEFLLTIVGRLAPEKRHEVLFKALAIVVQKHPFVKCLVVGNGPLKNELETMARDLNLSKYVIFAGIRKDMPAVYAACDLMVNASTVEGLPMTILEAMAAGLPIIATGVGAVPQVIRNGENGILLDPNDPGTLAEAVTQLIEDPQKRRYLADQAYSDVTAHFSERTMFDNYKQFYKEALVNQ